MKVPFSIQDTLSTCFSFGLGSSSSRHPNQVTPKKSGLKNGQMKSKDDECFGDDIDEIPDTDFDFEGNLALFDKAAVFEEIETYERRSGTRSRGTPNEKPARYRHDENILESEPIVYRRIVVPQNPHKEFCTGMPPPFLIRTQTAAFWGGTHGGFLLQGVSVSLMWSKQGQCSREVGFVCLHTAFICSVSEIITQRGQQGKGCSSRERS